MEVYLSSLILKEGETKDLDKNIIPPNATNQNVIWCSSNPSVATVHKTSGFVRAQNEGSATIYATAEDGSEVYGTCSVVVGNNPYIEVNEWLRLYRYPTVNKVGRVVNIPTVEPYIGSNGVQYYFTDRNCWCTQEPEMSTLINPNAVYQIIAETGVAPTIQRGTKGELMDENGRYWIAVGPNVVNPNHQPNQVPSPDEMYAKGVLDVVLKDQTGKLWYMPAIVGDTKAHTWTNGIIQTYKKFPNGQYESAGGNYNGTVAVELIGATSYDAWELNYKGYEIEKIIFYDN